jgi:hypothetical protein
LIPDFGDFKDFLKLLNRDQAMFFGLVLGQQMLPVVGHVTALNRARVPFVAGVSPLMVVHVCLYIEVSGAVFALVRCLTGMGSFVNIEITDFLEFLPTKADKPSGLIFNNIW